MIKQILACDRCGLMVVIALFSLLLFGCESKQEPNTLSIGKSLAKKSFDKAYTLKGLVSNDKQTIKNGRVEATDLSGQILATSLLVDNARYRIELPAGTAYPVILTAISSRDSEQLRVVVTDPTLVNFDITSLTTSIADQAKKMGGYTKNNLQRAAIGGVAVPERDTSQAGFRGDPTKQFGGWH